jgi:GNAT superfamily N-acetyltransferase
MRFELTEALIEDILFSMEDQEGDFLVDTQEGMLVEAGEMSCGISEKAGDRYLAIPDWDSSDGFRLMERFAAGLRNPMVREELSGALNRGKGVFRAFKDILGLHPEAEKLWFAFKEREMKREILRWYNALREEWGLERIGLEPEETGDLVLEDFRFRGPLSGDEAPAAELHRLCVGEYRQAADHKGEGDLPGEDIPWIFPGDYCVVAEAASGEFAGYISMVLKGAVLRIRSLEVQPEYRGLGLGGALLTRMLEEIKGESVFQVSIIIPAGVEGFARVLHRNAFKVSAIHYDLRITP